MDWVVFIGLMLGGVILVGAGAMIVRLRGARMPPRIPQSLAVGMGLIAALLLAASVITGHWLTAASAALNVLVWALLFVVSRRAGTA